ncbi:MAG: flagellar biosynthetic protein FliR [Acidimicrobiia bacterium]|nr:flagellar biosynthetic protein FliR [Acidimicrobiia bacterium]MDH4306997.1 flagellar biosynthetic protein FliR [Acidimicrobiia bacterium]MDH5292239.1 flagellar biosynthetic protein FliR [Acidimicrobiia bacterium]
METLIDVASMAGIVLSITRVGAFVAASPVLRAFPVSGRMAYAFGIGLALAQPTTMPVTMSGFVVAMATNVGVGIVLGFLTGILLHAFEVAGSIIDLNSGLNASQIFDPLTGQSVSVFGRAFNLAAMTLWLVMGGDRLAIEGLAATTRVIPLDGALSFAPGLAETATTLVAQMLVAAVQLTIPTFAALLVAEVALGVASRFAPQANVFALGLPAKLAAALATVSLVVLAFPGAIDTSMSATRDIVVTTVRGLGG